MRLIRHGFTLAEVLLSLVIVGIIIAMGMKITQNMTQRAYDKYWAIGYINLYDVLADMNSSHSGEEKYWDDLTSQDFQRELQSYFAPAASSVFNNTDKLAFDNNIIFDFKRILAECGGSSSVENTDEGNTVTGTGGGNNSSLEFKDMLSSSTLSIISLEDKTITIKNDNESTIDLSRPYDENTGQWPWQKTNNGIQYAPIKLTIKATEGEEKNTAAIIVMTVPQPTRGNNRGQGVTFFYFDSTLFDYGRFSALIPLTINDLSNLSIINSNNLRVGFTDSQLVDLQNSPLLGFKIGNEDTAQRRTYRDAWCSRSSDSDSDNSISNIIDCDGINPSVEGQLTWVKK